ncbi:hypothetical protein H4S02_005157, partial [Coemansia sp. RSA 2611]
MVQGYSPFLTKYYQLLPEAEQYELRLFSDALKHPRTPASHLDRIYSRLQKKHLHQYLTIHAMQRLMRRIASADAISDADQTPSHIITGLLEDYSSLGFMPGASEYGSLIRALALERGRDKEALQLLDSVVDSSEIAPFLRSLKPKQNAASSVADLIPTDEEISRIEATLKKNEDSADEAAEPDADDRIDRLPTGVSAADQTQALATEQRWMRQQRQQRHPHSRRIQISRDFYHMAMRGFAQTYHIRGVMEILARMLQPATQVPYRIARYLVPNRETWEIVGEVLSRQRDRPTFVALWVQFLSRGARPPLSLTQRLVRVLVHQTYVEQALWVMRISRCLPNVGEKLPKSPFAVDKVPWDLKVRIMHVASALEAATSLDTTPLGRREAMAQGRVAVQLPQLEKPDPDIYARLIGGAVRLRSDKLAEQLFRELVEAGVAPTGATYGHLAAMYAERKAINRVFLIVRDMLVHQHRLNAKQKLAEGALTEAQRERLKATILRQASMLRADVDCIVPLLRYYIQENRESEALALLRSWDLVHEGRVPADKLLLALLQVYDRPEDAANIRGILQELTRKVDRQQPSASEATSAGPASSADDGATYRAHARAIRTHIQARNIPGIVEVMRAIANSGRRPPYSIWEMALRGFLQEHMLDLFDTAHAFLRDTLKVPLSMPLYALWMRTLHNHGDVGGVQAAFDEMVALGQIPTQQHYLTLVLAYAYGGMLDQAIAIVQNLRRPGSVLRPGVQLESAVVEAYVASDEMERAEAELRRLLDSTHLPPGSIPARPFNSIIIGHLRQGSGDKAMRMYTEMVRLGVSPDVYTFSILMHSYATAKDAKNCMRVFNEMLRIGVVPNIVTYSILIYAFNMVRAFDKAEKVFQHVLHEQEWARAQVESQDLVMAGGCVPSTSPEVLDLYAGAAPLDLWDEVGRLSREERVRIRSFYNLDPVIYLIMLSLYRRSHRVSWALATWERFITNFPIVQWNPRAGGVESHSRSYTSPVHILAWTLLLRTVTKSIGAPQVFRQPVKHIRYFAVPLYSRGIRRRLNSREQQKLNLEYLLKKRPEDPRIRDLSERMQQRARIVSRIEAEIDERLHADRRFFERQRQVQPLPKLESQLYFNEFRYWMPPAIDLTRLRAISNNRLAHARAPIPLFRKRVVPASHTATGDPVLAFFSARGKFNRADAQDFAAILARQWRDLENAQFAFNNIHVAVYLPSMLVGRQYEDLIRFLEKVEPRRPADHQPPPPQSGYTYRNINIDPRSTRLLMSQLRI